MKQSEISQSKKIKRNGIAFWKATVKEFKIKVKTLFPTISLSRE